MSYIFFDSRSIHFKKPFGALKTEEQADFTLRLPKDAGYTSPRLLLFHADEWATPEVFPLSLCEVQLSANLYSCSLSLPNPGLYFYCFEMELHGKTQRLSRGADSLGVFSEETPRLWQLTVYLAQLQTPDFLKGGLIYQIFPDRFCASGTPKQGVPNDRRLHTSWVEEPEYLPDANGKITNSDYFCGDLPGITSRLPYLAELGVTCLYLNPIFEAHSSHRYNTADYMRVDPLLGTEEDLANLCEAGKKYGISVILDGVFSHTGDDSVYFNRRRRYPVPGAYESRESPYSSWYDFQSWPDKYSSWWGFETLPNVDEKNENYLRFICGPGGVLEHWLSLGVAGFRLDVADELPDEFLDALTHCVKAYNPQAIVLGEVWEDASNKVAYGVRRRYFLGGQLDSVMNYPFRDAILNFVRYGRGWELNETVLTILENYPRPIVDVLMNCLSTHDVERTLTRLAGEPLSGQDRQWQHSHHALSGERYAHAKRLLQLAFVLQFFLPGVPSLYYGEEAGMTGYRDPFNRFPFPWEQMDEELHAFVKNLSGVRTAYRALLSGADFLTVSFGNDIFAFTRGQGEGLFIAVNRGATEARVLLPFPQCEVLLGAPSNDLLAPYSFVVAKF